MGILVLISLLLTSCTKADAFDLCVESQGVCNESVYVVTRENEEEPTNFWNEVIKQVNYDYEDYIVTFTWVNGYGEFTFTYNTDDVFTQYHINESIEQIKNVERVINSYFDEVLSIVVLELNYANASVHYKDNSQFSLSIIEDITTHSVRSVLDKHETDIKSYLDVYQVGRILIKLSLFNNDEKSEVIYFSTDDMKVNVLLEHYQDYMIDSEELEAYLNENYSGYDYQLFSNE